MSCNDKEASLPPNIDHLVFTAPTLEQGMDRIESLLGVRPVIGGRHPQYGTHNALLSLGDSTYLEIIAPDPDLPAPARGRLLEDSYNQPPKLTTWVLRSAQIARLQSHAYQNGLTLGGVEEGHRRKPDGTIIRWKLSDPYAFPHGGTIPFLISWGNTPHPAQAVPAGGELIEVSVEHPDPETVSNALNILGCGQISVAARDTPKVKARIRTTKGIVTLE